MQTQMTFSGGFMSASGMSPIISSTTALYIHIYIHTYAAAICVGAARLALSAKRRRTAALRLLLAASDSPHAALTPLHAAAH